MTRLASTALGGRSLALLIATTGCGPAVDAAATGTDAVETTDGSGSSSGSASSTASSTTSASTSASTTTGEPGPQTSATSGGEESGTGSNFLDPMDGTASTDLPLGDPCFADDECESGHCFQFPGGAEGICSECGGDDDCNAAGTMPGTCGLGDSPWFVCTDGHAGALCQASENCQAGLSCEEVYPSYFQCSECSTSDDCADATACSPTFESGKSCVELESVALDGPCNLGEELTVCVSTHCTEALYDGTNPTGVGLCGECTDGDDCPDGSSCAPAFVDNSEFSGSRCE
jgi:hypothetical protein